MDPRRGANQTQGVDDPKRNVEFGLVLPDSVSVHRGKDGALEKGRCRI
jgi:hypothetical protein